MKNEYQNRIEKGKEVLLQAWTVISQKQDNECTFGTPAHLSFTINSFLPIVESRFTKYIASQVLKQVDARWPLDWWQAVKERFFPKWLLKKYPVLYKSVKLEARALYPDIALPEQNNQLILLKTPEMYYDE